MEAFCEELGFCAWFQTSAKDDLMIEPAANKLVSTILEKVTVLPENEEEDVVKLQGGKKPDDGECPC